MADAKEPVHVRYVCVNRLPDYCGECPLMRQHNGVDAECTVVDPLKSDIVGNPYDMTYRRSDCPLIVEEKC